MRLLISLLFLLISSPAWATTWYVRDGGSTPTNCTGTTNAVYPGSGTAQPCAFNHPAWVMGTYGANSNSAGKWVGGDTLSIDGDSDINSGQQAVYNVGIGMANDGGCAAGNDPLCLLQTIPAGSSGTPTSIIGTGTHKPLFLGIGGTSSAPYQVISAQNSYITLQWLEVSDNQACAYYGVGSQRCPGNFDGNGIEIGGNPSSTNLTMTDVYIHGMEQYGIAANGTTTSMGNATFTRLWVIGNGYGGFTTGGNNSLTGATWTFNQPIIEWNGCVEAYPLTHAGIDNPLNYSGCFGQQSAGYGDGLALGATASENPGSWTLIGPGSISFNTQDGLDLLHGTPGSGIVQIDKMRFEGNAGNQVKVEELTDSFTNNLIIGDCGWWYGAAQSATGAMQPGDSCRADGTAVYFNVTNGSTTNIYNNTIIANGFADFETADNGNTGCNSSTHVNIANNIILGGYWWYGNSTIRGQSEPDSKTSFYYNNGNDGNGSGTCGSLVPTENYNIVSTLQVPAQCAGSHDQCGASPGFSTGNFPLGTYQGNQSTYYTGQVGITLVNLGSSSPAIGAGESGLSFWNTSNDYYNVIRTNPPAIGGIELNSCAATTYGCQYNSSCCTNSCINNVCAGSCSANGQSCSTGATCCSTLCQSSLCVSCLSNGQSCSGGSSCCSGTCTGSICANPPGPTAIGNVNVNIQGKTSLLGKCYF